MYKRITKRISMIIKFRCTLCDNNLEPRCLPTKHMQWIMNYPELTTLVKAKSYKKYLMEDFFYCKIPIIQINN